MKTKPLKARCRYCKKEMISLYQNQLNQFIKVHELTCLEKNKKDGKS